MANSSIYLDAALTDAERRQRLYGGDIFVLSPPPARLASAARAAIASLA
jgi:hypothetical protein